PLTLAGQAQNGRAAALIDLQGRSCTDTGGTGLGTATFGPGVHCFPSSLTITGPVTLDAGGNPAAVFIFKIPISMTTATNSTMVLAGGAQACNIFWAIGSDAT